MRWVAALAALLDRLPWLLPLVGFAGGWLSFVLIQRGAQLAMLIALTVLAGWIWLLVQPFVRFWLMRYGSREMSNLVVNFVAQSIQQETLFFVLPFLYFATEFSDPGQILVLLLVGAAALLSTLDPLYERLIAKRHGSRLAFHCLCSMVAALVVLPIVVHVPLERVTPLALGFVLLWLLLVLPVRLMNREPVGAVLAAALILPAVVWLLRSHIPAAGIEVQQATLARGVQELEPVGVLSRVTEDDLANGLFLVASISAPLGLTQQVEFLWRHGDFQERISSTITGGRREGYRTYSHKQNFMEDPLGEWSVEIRTPQGQLLERVEFTVEPRQGSGERRLI